MRLAVDMAINECIHRIADRVHLSDHFERYLSMHGPTVRTKQRQELIASGGMHEGRETAAIALRSLRQRSPTSSLTVYVAGLENFLLHRVDHRLYAVVVGALGYRT